MGAMSDVYKPRVRCYTGTSGTGALTLGSAVPQFRAFADYAEFSDGVTVRYTLLDVDGVAWENGIGTIGGAGATLARTTVLHSTNSDNAISLSAGNHQVICTPDDEALFGNPATQVLFGPLKSSPDFTFDEATKKIRLGESVLISSTADQDTTSTVTLIDPDPNVVSGPSFALKTDGNLIGDPIAERLVTLMSADDFIAPAYSNLRFIGSTIGFYCAVDGTIPALQIAANGEISIAGVGLAIGSNVGHHTIYYDAGLASYAGSDESDLASYRFDARSYAWWVGIGDDKNALNINEDGSINAPLLNASEVVLTDASKNLISGGALGSAAFTSSGDYDAAGAAAALAGTLGSAAFTASTDYEVPLTFSTGLSRIGNTITATGTTPGDAAADGTTKGIAAFTAADFNAASGVISLDYTNGQAADSTHKGFLTSTDWATFNGKQAALTLGTGVATALAVNVGSAGAFVTFNGALGTPSSGTLTNATGLPAAGVVGTAAVLGSAQNFTAAQTNLQSIAAVSTDGWVLSNTTAAAVGAQQWSPRLRWTGSGWKTNATAAAQVVDVVAELVPLQAAASPLSRLRFGFQANAGGYAGFVGMVKENVFGIGALCAPIISSGASINGGTTDLRVFSTGTIYIGIGDPSSATPNYTNWWGFTAGHLIAQADNTYDIGTSASAGRPRNIYVGTTLTLGDAANIVAQTTTGTKIGTGTTQKLGFWNAAPVVQPTGYGTPTNAVQQGSFDATTITLPNLAAQVAKLILDLKAEGLVGA